MIDAHPAIKAVSPQAPIGDWFFDDVHRLGTCVLPSAFGFLPGFQTVLYGTALKNNPRVAPGMPDAYQAFLDLGSLKHVDSLYFKGQVEFWTQMTEHPNYDAFWEARNILPRLKRVAPAVLVVGGWFDTEDLYGTLGTYQAIEKQNPGVINTLVMGPWRHTAWATSDGESLGSINFGSKTSEFYRQNIEMPFFNHYLKDKPDPKLPEAFVFETGRNRWRTFDHWPPASVREKALYVQAGGKLSWESPTATTNPAFGAGGSGFDEFVSDPAHPVPFTEAISRHIPAEYMTDDQRFATRRGDVLVYQTEPLADNVTLAGPITADLWVSTSAGDADWVVKVIDVNPPRMKEDRDAPPGRPPGGYQMLVRGEVIRGRFRDGYATPRPFTPNEPTLVRLPLQDVMHTFRAGHRIMIQIQSSWFPMIDRNPQKYVDNIFQANDDDFIKATHRVYHDAGHPTRVRVGVLE
jgi:putative CocE/NonD family hydrolase